MNEPAPAYSDDAFLGGRVMLLQPEKGVRAGIDAVFLAASIPAEAGDRLVEAGIGSGAASLCLNARVGGLKITGLETEPESAVLAQRNIERNNAQGAVQVIEADVTAPGRLLQEQGIEPDAYDHVFANPPYYDEGSGRASSLPGKAAAHMLRRGDLAKWIKFMVRCARPGASISMIHRPEALAEIINALEGRAGALRILPLFPRPGAPAIRIIVQARKASRAPLAILSGLALQDETGRYSSRAEAVLRMGESFLLDEKPKP